MFDRVENRRNIMGKVLVETPYDEHGKDMLTACIVFDFTSAYCVNNITNIMLSLSLHPLQCHHLSALCREVVRRSKASASA